jgi:hypothetical protein
VDTRGKALEEMETIQAEGYKVALM